MSATPLPRPLPASRSLGSGYAPTHLVLIPALLALLAFAVQFSSVDLAVTRHFFDADANRFPLQAVALIENLGHQVLPVLPGLVAAVAVGLLIASYRVEWFRPWRAAAASLLLAMLLAPLTIAVLKQFTALPRPYALAMFGGGLPWPTTFWAGAGQPAGHALPSHHAGSGFAVGLLYFLGLAMQRPRLRWCGLAAGMLCGAAFAWVRIAQGAHFLSQTCWSALIVWTVGALCFWPVMRRR
ncbi:acid phosphatase [Bordetella genomosp. 1]|uniref:Acid phosphatase n=1 Tax=Bordetella genomosp. 1 TaxID=1395607 RepID=A0A261SJ74_9BORD|nr:phosphatase PAP2 family protein [Bordetella genomosp. 1]OZI36393.1 acid phosphatase [Bordetella genomosp. 1]